MISLLATTISLLATTIIATGRASAVESVGVLNPCTLAEAEAPLCGCVMDVCVRCTSNMELLLSVCSRCPRAVYSVLISCILYRYKLAPRKNHTEIIHGKHARTACSLCRVVSAHEPSSRTLSLHSGPSGLADVSTVPAAHAVTTHQGQGCTAATRTAPRSRLGATGSQAWGYRVSARRRS